MTKPEQSPHERLELLSLLVIATGLPVAGEAAGLQVFWLIAFTVAALLMWRDHKRATSTPS